MVKKVKQRESARLDTRLNDYSAVTRVSATAENSRKLRSNWQFYAAAASSALAMATNASADIIYSGIQNITVTAPGSLNAGIQPIDLDGSLNGDHILNLVAGSGLYPLNGTAFGYASLRGGPNVGIFNVTGQSTAQNFALNAHISAAAGSVRHQGVVHEGFSTGSNFGNFVSGQTGFAGLAIEIAAGQYDYGWIRLIFADGPDSLPASLTAVDWAIDTSPNAAIEAGQTTSPASEPGSLALALLASGAAGVEALRRRATRR